MALSFVCKSLAELGTRIPLMLWPGLHLTMLPSNINSPESKEIAQGGKKKSKKIFPEGRTPGW